MNQNRHQNNRRNFLSKMLITGVSGVALLTGTANARGRKGGNTGGSRSNTTSAMKEEQKDSTEEN